MNFDQEVLEAKRLLEGGQTVAPAQLHQETLSEPMSTDPPLVKQETDLLDPFDRQVQDAQKILGDSQTKQSFDSWFGTEYPETKEFLEATGESMVQLGYGALTFLPSYGMGFATTLNEKLKNVLRQDRIDETVRRGGFSEDRFPTDLARKPMTQRLEEAKIKTPAEIRKLAESSAGFFAEVMEEPVTEGGKKVIGKAGELMDWLFHYPHQADKKLADAGYPNLGYFVGFAGEMLLMKGMHGAAKKGKKLSKNALSRYIKTVGDIAKIETPADVRAVSSRVDKILDQLGITEEQRTLATDKTFRTQRDVGSWIEERARIRREVPSVRELKTKTKLEIPKEEVSPEVILEKPSVRKLNIGEEAVKKTLPVTEPKIKEPPRVDPEFGKPPGVKADLKKYERSVDVKAEMLERRTRIEAETAALRTAEGKIVGSKVLASRMAKSRGLVGDIIKTPDGKGWYVKKTKEMRKIETAATKKLWDDLLKEEDLGVVDILKSERGAVTISAEIVKKLRDKVRSKKVTEVDLVTEMQRRKVPKSQILRAFPNAFKETPIVGTSDFLKRRQDPEDFLPRRIVKRKTGRMKYARLAPAVTRGDAHIVSTFTNDLKAARAHEKLRIATSEGLFTEMGKKMKETFLYPMRAADKSMTIASTTLARESNRLKKMFRLGTRQKHAEKIGIYEIAQQKDGLARLKAQGIKNIPTKLTPKEQIVYDTLQKTYKNLFVEINLARRAIGEQLFPPVENYSAWFHDLSRAVELDNLSPTANLGKLTEAVQRLKAIPTRIDRISRAPGMKGHEKFRAGPETPGYLHLNTFDNFETYAKIANRVIHMGPTTAYLHELLLPRYKLAQNAPNTWNFLSEWLDFQKGIEPIGLVKNAKTRRWIRQGSSNVAVSYITYAWSSALNQISSLPNSAMFIGYPRLVEGLIKMTAKSQFDRASKTSDVLMSRSPETVLMEAGRSYPLFKGKAGRTLSDVWKKTATVGSLPLTTVDNIVAHATWLGAEAQARRIYKSSKTYQEMPRAKQVKALEDFTKHYADDVVIEAQGSAARSERAPIQRTAEGAAATTLQTFVIANYDLLKRQMLGIGGPKMSKAARAQRITRLLVGYAAVGYFFDQIGMRSPNPQPVKAALEVLDEEDWETDMEKYGKIVGAAAKELIEYIPIVGGKLKYGSEIGGPILSELIKVTKGDFTGFWRLVGTRGFSQLLKSYRAYKKEGTDVDIVFGRYVDDDD